MEETSGLLAAADSNGLGNAARCTPPPADAGLTFVEELDLAAARMERMSASGDALAPIVHVPRSVKREPSSVKPTAPRGTHNSVDLSAKTAWELCIKNSELTMDEDEDRIGMGGTGTVYKALWCGAPVAVKKIYYGDDHDHGESKWSRCFSAAACRSRSTSAVACDLGNCFDRLLAITLQTRRRWNPSKKRQISWRVCGTRISCCSSARVSLRRTYFLCQNSLSAHAVTTQVPVAICRCL